MMKPKVTVPAGLQRVLNPELLNDYKYSSMSILEYTPKTELVDRIGNFQKELATKDVDGVIICQNVDLFYLAGSIQRSFLFVPLEGKPILAVIKSFDRAVEESALDDIVSIRSLRQVPDILSDFGYSNFRSLGLELDILPVNYYERFREVFPMVEFQDISESIKRTRMIKSEYEVDQIRRACHILDDVFEKAGDIIREGMTEIEIDGMLYSIARKAGHQGISRMRGFNQEMLFSAVLCGSSGTIPSFGHISVAGYGATPAVAQCSGLNKIKCGQPIQIDIGVAVEGYHADVTRTYVIGDLPEKYKKAYLFLKEVKEDMINYFKPGAVGAHFYEKTLQKVEKTDYAKNFLGYDKSRAEFLGHGLGLEINEYPLISGVFREPFQKNMVFAFEPKFVFPGMGAIGVEDDFVVTDTGVEMLNTISDDIFFLDNV